MISIIDIYIQTICQLSYINAYNSKVKIPVESFFKSELKNNCNILQVDNF